MKLSAPIFILKQQAKTLSRRERIPLHAAQDRIARREGFKAWSLLAAEWSASGSHGDLLSQLRPGDLVLIAARPGQGKTLLGIRLAAESVDRGNRSAFFTLEFTEVDVARCCRKLDIDFDIYRERFMIDASDLISSSYIAGQLASAPPNMLVVIDYLQLLDQRRENPSLMEQVAELKRIAEDRRIVIVCLSQVDRRYDPESKPFPGFGDVRLPNPVDLSLFDKACFLSRGRIELSSRA